MRTRLIAPMIPALLALSLAVAAETPPPFAAVPEPPPLPPPVRSGEALEPDITIIQGEHKTIREYRVHGKLYLIEVRVDGARPYYLVDADGDGELETRLHELAPDFLIPQWVLFSW